MHPESKVNVLMVDDHLENLLFLEAVLASLGQNLVKAHSGAEALSLLNQDFAVILLDVQMPDMDGFETATLIRNRSKTQHTPIIFLTAFSASDNLVLKGYSLGAVDYLVKPIEPEILISKVAVFVDLFKKTAQIERQALQLMIVNAELKESEERFRSLSACSHVGIFMTDVEGRCTYTNSRCRAVCGFPLEDNFIAIWLQSVHPEDREQVLADWFAWTHEDNEYSQEFRLLTQEKIRWVHLRSSPILSDQGKVFGYVGTIEDITQCKQTEEERGKLIREQEARQQAEAANRMKDEFLATLSHELRTPLNSMLGWARLLRTRKFDEHTTARALETIERNAKAQAQLIEDILDVSRITQGKLRLNMRSVNLAAVIEAVIDAVRPAADAKSIELKSLFDEVNAVPSSLQKNVDSSTFSVLGDPDRLQQIIWNLLSNALKFTPAGGKVEVRLERVNSHTHIRVSDTGIGINKDFLPYVFERFRQADSATTRSEGGLGLGLAIVRHLVELHGGSVHVDSDGEGQGATFTVKLLPGNGEKGEERGSKEVGNSAPLPLDKFQVMVVDDDSDTRDFLTTVLEQHGAKVTAVASVSESLELLQQLKPDVLVSDIGMPIEDGYELIRKVRALNSPEGKIPAIALTAYASVEEQMHALSAGFQRHLSKPVEPAELIAHIQALLPKPIVNLSH